MWRWNKLACASYFIPITFITFVLNKQNKTKKKTLFLELLGEKYHPILFMGLLSKDNTDNHDCFGEARLSADGGLQGNIDGEDNHR